VAGVHRVVAEAEAADKAASPDAGDGEAPKAQTQEAQ
jgi:hypothetical protein